MRPLRRDELRILKVLYRARCFGKGHLLEDNLLRHFPSNMVGDARDAVETLKREGIVVVHKTAHGVSVFIDASLRLEVYAALLGIFPWLPR